jgi:hypothetical protein
MRLTNDWIANKSFPADIPCFLSQRTMIILGSNTEPESINLNLTAELSFYIG